MKKFRSLKGEALNSKTINQEMMFHENLNRSIGKVLYGEEEVIVDSHWSHDGGIGVFSLDRKLLGSVGYDNTVELKDENGNLIWEDGEIATFSPDLYLIP